MFVSVEGHGGEGGSRECSDTHGVGIGASHGDGSVTDGVIHVHIDEGLGHASVGLMLLLGLLVLHEGIDAALGSLSLLSAVSIDLALSFVGSKFHVLSIDGIVEVLVKLLHLLLVILHVFLISAFFLFPDVVRFLENFGSLGNLEITASGITNLLLREFDVLISNLGRKSLVLSGNSSHDCKSNCDVLHFLFILNIL